MNTRTAAVLSFDFAQCTASNNSACDFSRVVVLPDGEFEAVDGRPSSLPGVKAQAWRLNAALASALIKRFNESGVHLPVDYEHQTLRSEVNGQAAPAAGWIAALQYMSGKGLVATVQWTQTALEHLQSGAYKYLSPVLIFDQDTGDVLDLHSVALTGRPGLGALGQIKAALSALSSSLSTLPPGSGGTKIGDIEHMDKAKVLVALGLPLDTGDDSALAALAAAIQKTKDLGAKVAELAQGQFDPAKHIPLEEHKKVADALAALQEAGDKAEHDKLMAAALGDGRILPANESYWRAQPLSALQVFLKDARPLLGALGGTQTGGKPPAAGQDGAVALSAEEQQACAALGMTTEQFVAGRI